MFMNRLYNVLVVLIIFMSQSANAQTTSDSLIIYIEEAIRNNPAVKSEYNAYKAQRSEAIGSGTVDDPTLEIGWFPNKMQHVNGKQIATFSIMQMFPWFGTLKAGRESKEYKAESTYQRLRADGIALAYEVQKQWYTILATKEKIKAVQSKLILLRDVRKAAVYNYSAQGGKQNTNMSDQLRIEAEQKVLDEQAESLYDQLTLQQQQLNIIMHRNANSPLSIPDTLTLREMPEFVWEEIERHDPLLQQNIAEGMAFDALRRQASGLGMPMVGIGLQYMLNGRVDHPMMADMNGNDMLMPMLSISLPVYRRRVRMNKLSAKYNKMSSDFTYQSNLDNLRKEYLSINQRSVELKRKIKLYDDEVDLLDRTLALMTTEYSAGTTSLSDLLNTNRQYIDYALKKAEAYAEYNTLVAEYEKMASRYDYAERVYTHDGKAE